MDVCGECFNDQGLKDFCSGYADSTECDFCGAIDNQPIAAQLDYVIEHINTCVRRHFDDPSNAGLAYESREGGWQGTTYDTREVFEELGLAFPNDKGDRLFKAICSGLHTDFWSAAEPYALTASEQLRFSWENFCHVIKHQRRYFFFQDEDEDDDGFSDKELLSPSVTLNTIFAYAREAGAFITLPAGTHFYRARHQSVGEVYNSASTLGPPPLSHAIQTNRMSPPGVVMTYTARDRETALAETANAPGTFAIGKFSCKRKLLVLDLTDLPEAPSLFAELSDSWEYDPRPRLNFLHEISYEISRPIARDNRVHIEYVPTQVVTEYIRTVVRIDGQKVDGILYASSRQNVGNAIVLFADESNLVLEKVEQAAFYRTDERWLALKEVTTFDVTEADIKKWAAPFHPLWDEIL